MLYNKNKDRNLDRALFEAPTSEYRGTPFWSWNNKLEKDELIWQIEQLKAMGFGGFHMHSRAGMGTEYLGKDFMDMVKACNEKAKAEKMLAWLYDEDRWPSGFAGGYVTKNPKHRQKFLHFTVNPLADVVDRETGHATGKSYLLACYDVSLNADGTLAGYARIGEEDAATGKKWYVYVSTPTPVGRFNGQTYVDTLSEEAIAEFIRVTYDAYYEAVGKDFGGSVPAIFTDEPQFCEKMALPYAESQQDIRLPYTYDFAETFQEEYGLDLLTHLPELLWDLPDGKPSKVRYCYHDHACERFTRAFSDQCGKWCDEHGIALTGHVMREDTLKMQTNSLGEVMRTYRGFGIPGIDVLCNEKLLLTAKQCQSAKHQYGREAMLSELYGVTGWDFDFRGHKYQGDWQAALGVTVRVPHLSWVTMKGSAKRDYPASIFYQSAWYKEYPYIEDHYARVNTALTRGKPAVKVAVIHPVESYWLRYGPMENTAEIREQLQYNFDCVTEWLLYGTIDFDYISEALLPSLYRETTDPTLGVGAMEYSAVVVPGVETIRASTLDALEAFRKKGGKVIFMGECPTYVDAELSDRPKALYASSTVTPFSSVSLLAALSEERDVSIRDSNGVATDCLIYQMREDVDCKWLFIAHGAPVTPPRGHISKIEKAPVKKLRITVKGEFTPTVYDTLTGKTRTTNFELRGGNTVIAEPMYEHDSLLLRLDPVSEKGAGAVFAPEREIVDLLDFKEKVEYTLHEPNVLVLDMARLSRDGVQYDEVEEMLRIDEKLREELKFPKADGRDLQPWLIEEEKITNFPYLKFEFESEIETDCRLAYEELSEVTFNGESVPISRQGYFTDRYIYTMPMPRIKRGKNELIVRVPFGKRISLENFFLLGDFGVRVEGTHATVTALPEKLAFGTVTTQGLPFYGAALTYRTTFELDHVCDADLRCDMYRGALVGVKLDGKDVGRIVFSPYKLPLRDLKAGTHTLELTLYASRVNCFNALHNCGNASWIGPDYWYSKGVDWSYEYCLKNVGVMKSPVLEILEPEQLDNCGRTAPERFHVVYH